jgi:hypothetical protein
MPKRHSRPDRTVGTAGRGVRGRPGEEIVTGRSEFRSRARLTACKSETRLTPTTTARRSAQPAASLWASPSTRTDQRDTSVSSAAFPTIRRRVPSCERPIFRRGVVRRSGVVSWDAHPAYVSVAVPTKDDAANRRGDGQSRAGTPTYSPNPMESQRSLKSTEDCAALRARVVLSSQWFAPRSWSARSLS